jgi:hypothetical protein
LFGANPLWIPGHFDLSDAGQSCIRVRTGLLALDVRGLDDRPPFFEFRFLERGQGFGRLLLARKNLLSDIGKALAY